VIEYQCVGSSRYANISRCWDVCVPYLTGVRICMKGSDGEAAVRMDLDLQPVKPVGYVQWVVR
jgi:hypothetical protein